MGALSFILTNDSTAATETLGQLGPVCRVPTDPVVVAERTNCSNCVCPYCHVSHFHL